MRISLFAIAILISACTSSKKLSLNRTTSKLSSPSADDLKKRSQQIKKRTDSAKIITRITATPELDSFGDRLFNLVRSGQHDQITLIRQAKKATVYIKKQVWAVQIAALTDSENANQLVEELKSKYQFPVRNNFDKQIYKIRIGAYENRSDADQLLFDLKREGYQGSWVVQDEIKIIQSESKKVAMTKFFYLQIGNFSSELFAMKLKKESKQKMEYTIIVKRYKGFFKVLVAKKTKKHELNQIKTHLSDLGYPSFIVEL